MSALDDNLTPKKFLDRLEYFVTPLDGRFEGLAKGSFWANLSRDFTAGLIVAMVAIPMAMGFAMASGLRPEQGIIGGAVAGVVGALFGGSKYQVYGPTAAFIPIISGIVATYGYPYLVLASIVSGLILCSLGLARLGRYASYVPHSIIVGFTMGIAVVIAMSQIGEAFTGAHAFFIALVTFLICKLFIKVSPFVPAPFIAVLVATVLSATVFQNSGLVLIKDKYGSIPSDFFVFTPPQGFAITAKSMFDLVYFSIAIVFVAAVESVLCSRMADRLAENKGMPFNANKELWGQGLVNIIVPIINGFPHTGALARTAVNIKVGAISPMAGIFKGVLKIMLAIYTAQYLELIPMAAICGILLYVATSMVKVGEVKEVFGSHKLHIALMAYTAVMVPLTDFLTGVLSAMILYGVAMLATKQGYFTKAEKQS